MSDLLFVRLLKECSMPSALSTRLASPFRPFLSRDPLFSFQQEMENLMTRLRADWNGDSPTVLVTPPCDVSETEDAVQIRLDAPGYKAEEISIECTGDVIRISGQHKEEQSENGRTWHRVERRSGAFQRELGLPMPIKEDQITAECVNGVLTVRMPKAETARTRKIKVKG